MMASSSHVSMYLPLFKNLQHNNIVLNCFRGYAKKYNYNLNDLIDWKKKTDLAFGSPRKLTKTGKLRKTKSNKNEQFQSTLESLSAQSAHLNRHASGFNDFSCISRHAEFEPAKETTIPEAFLAEQVSLSPDDDSTGKSLYGFVATEGIDDTVSFHELLENETTIHASRVKNSQQNSFEESSRSNSLQELDIHCDGSIQGSFRKKQHVKKENDDNDFQIPVIPPIPSKYTLQKSYNNTINEAKAVRVRSNKSSLQPKTSPTEPPKSFDLINEIPLDFGCHSLSNELSNKILNFKEDTESLSLRLMPSVKSILNKTMPPLNRFFLNRWREGMIKELGEEGFKAHQDQTIKRGINFHANVMELLSGKQEADIQIMPDNEGHWASLQTAMRHISDVGALEEDLRHPALLYRGVLDCLAKYKDVLCVIDWKTSKKPRPLLKNTYDDPLQVAAYMGLVNAHSSTLSQFGEVNHGLLVVIYPDGSPAHIHFMNKTVCEQYWQDWLSRLYQYYQLVYTEKFGS